MARTWRESAAPIIKKIMDENPDIPEKELKKIISKAYPFGLRQYHPYKIWCDEVKKQLLRRYIKEKQMPVAGGLFDPEKKKLL